ncbi:MAG: hypothetical protein V7722_03715, partial [Porticoccus sp.]
MGRFEGFMDDGCRKYIGNIIRGKGRFMIIGNLNIERIIIHEIYQRGENNLRVAPKLGEGLIDFDDAAMSGFKSRVTEALGQDSKAVQMEISNESSQSTAEISTGLHELDVSEFIDGSGVIANKLADAQ